MVSDTPAGPRGKNKVDDNNPRRTLSNRKEMAKCSLGKDGGSSWRRLGRETLFYGHSTPIRQITTEFKKEKRKKEKNVIQLVMESEKAEFQLEMGRKIKKMTAHAYKAQFKAQRMKTVVSDTDEAIEGPNAVVTDKVVAGPPDSVDSENSISLQRSRDCTVHSETGEECRDPKDINGVMVGSERFSVTATDNVVIQPSDGNCLKESRVNKLHTNSSPVKNLNSLEKEALTCSARLQDGVVSESDVKCMHPEATETTLFPESVNDSRPAIGNVCSRRKRVSSDSTENDLCSCGGAVNKDLGRLWLCTCKNRVQYSNESPNEPNIDNSDVGNKRRKVVNENVDPESVQVELNGHQATQVANRERGPSIIATCNQSQSLQKNGVTPTSNLNSNQTSSGEISLSDEQKSLYSSLLEELMKLCNILKLPEDVTHMARRFLEYVIKNHHISSDSPAIVQAFQISLCWIAASISKQTVDKKDSLMLARQHLNYQCENHIQSVYSKMRTLKRMYLAEQDVNREPFNERGAEPVSSKLPDVKKEIGVKSPSEEHGRNETDNKILKLEKKCRKRQKKLQRKHQEKIQEFHNIWNEKRKQLDSDHRLETAFIRFVFSEVSVRTERLKRLNEAFAWKIENHNLLKDVELKHLEAEQLVAMNGEKQKAERWLTAAKACNAEPIAVNVPPLIDGNAGVSQLAINTTVDATRVVSESTEQVADQNASESESTRHFQDQNPNENDSPRHLEDQIPSETESTQHLDDQNPSESVCANGNASAPANTSISARADPVHCDIPTEMRKLVTSDFHNEVVAKDIDGSSIDMVEQSDQSKPLCDSGELVCTKLRASGDQLVKLTTESSVEVPAKAPNENVSQDEIHSSFAEPINQNELVVQNQHDSQVGVPELKHVDTVTAVQSNGELEEGEIQEEVELEEGEIQEEGPTMENQGTKEQPIMEKQRTVNSETVAIVVPVLITEQPDGNVPVLENQHTSEIQVETLQPVNDSLTDGQSNIELQDLVTHALEIESTSEVANSDLVDTVDPAQPIREQPRADSPTIGNQNAYFTQVPFSSQTADVAEAEALSHEPASQIDPVQPITEQAQADAETVGSQNTCLIEAPISIQTADVAEFEALTHEPASQIVSHLDTAQPITEQSRVDAETFKSQNASHIEAPISSKGLQKGDKWKHTGDHSSVEEGEFSKNPDNQENNGQGPDVNNNQAGKTSNLSDKPSRSRSLTPSPDEKQGTGRHSSPSKSPVLSDARESREENIPSSSPVRSPARKSAQPSDSNRVPDLSRSPSPDGAQKRVRKRRGFTERYAFVRRYRTPSPEPDRSYLYGGRDVQRNNDRYSSYRGRFERSPQGRYHSPSPDDCSTGIHEPASQIGSVHPITEQPLADAETVENQNTCLTKASITIQTANVAEFEALSHETASQIVSQIDTIQPITEQPRADAETVKSQNASHIESPVLFQTADVAEAEALPLEPVKNHNTSLIEVPFSSQIADVAETEVHSHEPVSQIEFIQPITEQPQADAETAENQNPSLIEVPFSFQIADVAETEISHEPVSQSVENLETGSVSHEQIVELTTSSESNEPICESVIGEAELLIEGVAQNVISTSYLYRSGHLVPSLNTHSLDPIESELEKTIKEKEEFERSHVNMVAQLKSDFEKEIEEMMNQIKHKYGMQLQVAEAEFRQRRSEFQKYLNKLQMNRKLAKAFRNKFADLRFIGHPVNQQGTSQSVYMQQMHHPLVHPSLRVITNASNFQPSPSHSNASFVEHPIMPHPMRFSQITSHSVTAPHVHYVTAPLVHSRSHPNASSVRPHIMPHHSLARPTRSSPITSHSVTAPPLHSVQHMQALFSIPPRPPPVISSNTPSHNPRASGEIRSTAPHLQSFRPSVDPTTSPSITQNQPTFQDGPVPQGGLLAEPAPHPSTMTWLWEMDPWSRVRANSSSGFYEIRPNYTSLGLGVQGKNVQGNRSSCVVPNDVVCLSDDD